MSEDIKKYLPFAKWIIGTVSACILVYLGIRYIHVIADCIWWLIQLTLPILIGIILAMILNIPLHFFENHLFKKKVKSNTLKRNLSITFSLLSVISIFILALFLVIPELVQAIITLINIGTESIAILSDFTESIDYSTLPFGTYLARINIDWSALASRMQDLLPNLTKQMSTHLPGAISSSFGLFVDLFLGLIFSIYILAQKEKFVCQIKRLIFAWLPDKICHQLLHIADVCSQSFHNFIVGQSTEAMILGTLCAVGMGILRLPYAPTIGVLVGVTAFIPYVGAYLGAIIGCIIILTVHPFKALIFVIFLIVLQQIEGNIIYPKVVGNRINLPSIWVLAALTIGGNLAGPFGMLLGVPIFSAAYNLITEATRFQESKKRRPQE